MKHLSVGILTGACLLFNMISLALSDEYSIIKESTVIGCNYGYPSGTPVQGHTPVGKIDLVFETAFFFKNLELFGLDGSRGIEGKTFFGFLLPARGRYRAHDQLTFELGAVLGQDFGDEDELNIVEPLVRLVYRPKQEVFSLAGTILPTHWIHDGLLDDIQKFRTNTEQGFQFRIDFDWLKDDTWINWRVREDEFTAEEFEVGNATQLRLLDGALWIYGELLWAHVGGQLNRTGQLQNNEAILGGLSYGFGHPFRIETVDELRIGANYLYSIDDGRNAPKVTGDGYELFATVDVRALSNLLLRAHVSYFSGDEFQARRGDPLYGLAEYGQLGATALFVLPAGLRIETGIIGQLTDGELNCTYLINFTWGQAFTGEFLRPRQAKP